ncbi:hypothetical protein X798_00561 [Onchocerca flexuosa]|uniref:Uncharacterized protein n=1 Tax=Onchocerca flexuosa TaxID=387005 RepID=A0A238C6H6_9BILA|nr:hypothetical protein X798_00561 [Onchocerca flexuosa]
MIQRPTATIIRRNFYHRNYKYHQINESKLSKNKRTEDQPHECSREGGFHHVVDYIQKNKIIACYNSCLQTLWVAWRAIVFGLFIIAFGILMTVLGYFDVYLSQGTLRSGIGSIDKVILHSWNTSTNRITLRNRNNKIDKIFTTWAMRYFFKSLQYIGPIAMGIGTFILIIACVITFESRDKNMQMFNNVGEVGPRKKKSLLQRIIVQKPMTNKKCLPMTNKEICEWTPRYKAVPLSTHNSSPIMDKWRKYRSTPCIPQMLLDTIENRSKIFRISLGNLMIAENAEKSAVSKKLCWRYLDNYYCGIFDTENDLEFDARDHRACTFTSAKCSYICPRQNVTVELHNPPPLLLSSANRSSPLQISPVASSQQNQSSLHSFSNFKRTDDLACNEHNSSNIFVSIDPTVTAPVTDTVDSAVDVTRDNHTVPEESQRHAPLASLDIEFGTSSSSSSSNLKVPNIDSFLTV